VIVLEGFLQPVAMARVATGTLGPVGHDDVGMSVTVFAMGPVGMLDHLDEPMDMGIGAKVMTVKVLLVVPVRHGPMLALDPLSGQAAAG
jgi:hypothetical protein